MIWYAITGTWGFYLVGGLYVLAPAIAWLLTFWVIFKLLNEDADTPPAERVRVPVGVWVWIAGMLAMQVALVAAHVDFDLGLPMMIKSSVGWAKGWALLALFPLIGAALQIRPQVVVRAASLLAVQTLCLIPIFYLAPILHLPGSLYVSPLVALGGPGPEFFEVQFYGADPETGAARWRFFTPWAPAAGFVANVYMMMALQERHRGYQAAALTATVLMCFMSQSRLALVALAVVSVATYVLSRLSRPWILAGGGGLFGVAALWFNTLQQMAIDFEQRFSAARAASSRVRKTLGRIAVQRWESEAPTWGHGIVERGPHLVEYMPIGSHHTWYGLLYVKGLVGFLALLGPVLLTMIELIAKAQADRWARCALAIMLIVILYSFGENLEILVYLYWPGLILVGVAMRRRFFNPLRSRLGGRGSEPGAAAPAASAAPLGPA